MKIKHLYKENRGIVGVCEKGKILKYKVTKLCKGVREAWGPRLTILGKTLMDFADATSTDGLAQRATS